MTAIATPHGARAFYETREGTSDAALVGGIVGEDEYKLKTLPTLAGWAIDVGAHIGTVTVALALDNPDLQIVAVEALPENADVLRRNVDINGLSNRVHVLEGAAGKPGEKSTEIIYGWERADNQPDHYMHDNRFIGGMVGGNETSRTVTCPVVSLPTILKQFGIAEVELLKIDCEGCEWFFLRTHAVSKIKLILGEMHVGRHGGAKELRRMLEKTHTVEMDDSLVVAHFTAVRK